MILHPMIVRSIMKVLFLKNIIHQIGLLCARKAEGKATTLKTAEGCREEVV